MWCHQRRQRHRQPRRPASSQRTQGYIQQVKLAGKPKAPWVRSGGAAAQQSLTKNAGPGVTARLALHCDEKSGTSVQAPRLDRGAQRSHWQCGTDEKDHVSGRPHKTLDPQGHSSAAGSGGQITDLLDTLRPERALTTAWAVLDPATMPKKKGRKGKKEPEPEPEPDEDVRGRPTTRARARSPARARTSRRAARQFPGAPARRCPPTASV